MCISNYRALIISSRPFSCAGWCWLLKSVINWPIVVKSVSMYFTNVVKYAAGSHNMSFLPPSGLQIPKGILYYNACPGQSIVKSFIFTCTVCKWLQKNGMAFLIVVPSRSIAELTSHKNVALLTQKFSNQSLFEKLSMTIWFHHCPDLYLQTQAIKQVFSCYTY